MNFLGSLEILVGVDCVVSCADCFLVSAVIVSHKWF
jgi:hypothetical protein